MSDTDQRHITRDSLFVLAALRVDGREPSVRVKIRNLSAGGLMAEGDVRIMRGTPVSIEIRNVGWVEGAVAWVQDTRFGIAFDEEIDHKSARINTPMPATANSFVPLRPLAALHQVDPAQLRKI
jgi:hypothetical protein